MQKIYTPPKEDWSYILRRPAQTFEQIEKTVNYIFKDIELNGDQAVKKYASKYDKVALDDLMVSVNEIEDAMVQVSDDLKEAIQLAKVNIEKFHSAQKSVSQKIQVAPGLLCWQEKKPIQKVGLYIPGGTAPLFSTILMLAIPAKIAGCEEIILCTPSDRSGTIHPAILYTASLCGVTKIFKVGGIQAIGAMTFGTEMIPKVYKIFGPGNQYVMVAKQIATKYGVAIDLPAGPSELLVIADDSANPAFVASDLLSQAEHGEDSQVILIAKTKKIMTKVAAEIELQLACLPRKVIAKKAMDNSKLIYCPDDETALELINAYAPEHFIICNKNKDFYADNIQNAGSVFIGNYTPESAGDYASGTNHTLPTNGFSKSYSGVNLDAFLKAITLDLPVLKEATFKAFSFASAPELHKNNS